MRTLLVYPRFPKTFWSFEGVLTLVGRKALMPPLGLLTVAALLPRDWPLRLVDCSVRELTEADWTWAELVMVSGMIAQRENMLSTVREARARGKRVVVGGPYPTARPEEILVAGADFLVVDEAELSLPACLEAIGAGQSGGVFSAHGRRPDLTLTPVPRFDLLDLDAYDMMAVQFSRGCPYCCDFCDVIVLYGRQPRTKPPEQFFAELDELLRLGWNRGIMIVDDNLAGCRHAVKHLLRALREWQADHGAPFSFDTQASVDVALDVELVQLMADCRFGAVFLGIETPDEPSLTRSRKFQNTKLDAERAVRVLQQAGLRVMAGFIQGFDGEAPGAGRRIVEFVERADVPTALVSMLQALPNTALWKRLAHEGRLLTGEEAINPLGFTNFVPGRPIEHLAAEFQETYASLYDPGRYLDRAHRHFRGLGGAGSHTRARPTRDAATRRRPFFDWRMLRGLATVVWRQGMLRQTRWKFWHHLASILRHRRVHLWHYLSVCAHLEHFLQYLDTLPADLDRHIARHRQAAGLRPLP